jgi:hypothetical protein
MQDEKLTGAALSCYFKNHRPLLIITYIFQDPPDPPEGGS